MLYLWKRLRSCCYNRTILYMCLWICWTCPFFVLIVLGYNVSLIIVDVIGILEMCKQLIRDACVNDVNRFLGKAKNIFREMQKQTGTLHWNTWDLTAAYFLTHTHTVPKHTCTHRRRDFVGLLFPSKDPQMTWTKASSNTKPKSNLGHFKGKLLHMKTNLIRISRVISCSLRLTKYPGHRASNHLALYWLNAGTFPTVWATFSVKEELQQLSSVIFFCLYSSQPAGGAVQGLPNTQA